MHELKACYRIQYISLKWNTLKRVMSFYYVLCFVNRKEFRSSLRSVSADTVSLDPCGRNCRLPPRPPLHLPPKQTTRLYHSRIRRTLQALRATYSVRWIPAHTAGSKSSSFLPTIKFPLPAVFADYCNIRHFESINHSGEMICDRYSDKYYVIFSKLNFINANSVQLTCPFFLIVLT